MVLWWSYIKQLYLSLFFTDFNNLLKSIKNIKSVKNLIEGEGVFIAPYFSGHPPVWGALFKPYLSLPIFRGSPRFGEPYLSPIYRTVWGLALVSYILFFSLCNHFLARRPFPDPAGMSNWGPVAPEQVQMLLFMFFYVFVASIWGLILSPGRYLYT